MKLIIKDVMAQQEVEEKLELWLEYNNGDVVVMSKKGNDQQFEFRIHPDGSWYKTLLGNLKSKTSTDDYPIEGNR